MKKKMKIKIVFSIYIFICNCSNVITLQRIRIMPYIIHILVLIFLMLL